MISAIIYDFLTNPPLKLTSKAALIGSAITLIFAFSPANAATIVVPAGGDLQAAIYAANCGDNIVLQAGGTWDLSSPLQLPNKGCTLANPITIQSSISLPAGRVGPASAASMPRLRAVSGDGIFQFTTNASGWVLDSLNMTDNFTQTISRLVDVGLTYSGVTNNVIQRCLFYPKEALSAPTQRNRALARAVWFEGSFLTFRWNYAYGFTQRDENGNSNNTSVILTISGNNLTIFDNYMDGQYVSFFTGGGGESPQYTATISSASTTQANFSNVTGLQAGRYVRFELNGAGNLVGSVLTRTSGISLTAADTQHTVFVQPSGGGATWRARVDSVSGNDYTLSSFGGSQPSGPVTFTVYEVANVTSVAGSTVHYTPVGVNYLTQAPSVPGGAAWRVDQVVHDIFVTKNTFNIDVALAQAEHAASGNNPKGWVEYKAGDNIVMEGNTFTGYPSVIGVTQHSNEGYTPWTQIKNLTIRSNFVNSIFDTSGTRQFVILALIDPYNSDEPGSNAVITNNLVKNTTNIAQASGGDSVVITHNTVLNDHPSSIYGSSLLFGEAGNPRWTVSNNIAANNSYGITCSVDGAISTCFPSFTMAKNVIIDNAYNGDLASRYGSGILNPVVTAFSQVAFADVSSNNYRLASTSPFKNTATDGTDPGIDMDALLAALNSTAPPPTPTPTPAATPTPTPTPSATPTPTATPTPSPGVGSSAAFLQLDSSTQGNWKSAYGADGYNTISDAISYPSYAQVNAVNSEGSYVWAASTADVRGLQKAANIDRLAATWYATSMFSLDVNLTDGLTHRVALYCLDWDKRGRAQTLDVVDASTNALLDSRTISGFENGQYMVWNIQGHVRVNVLKDVGVNSVVSGVYFGAAAANPSPTPTPSPSPTPSGNNLPSVTITAPVNGANFTTPANITLTASASDSDGNVVRVDFYRNGTLMGTSTASPYTLAWSSVPSGSYTLTAIATDNLGATQQSAPISISVLKSRGSVGKAKGHVATVISDYGTGSNNYAGAADPIQYTMEPTSPLVSDLGTLTSEIQAAYDDFLAERDLFGNNDNRIDAQLQAALYFCRSDAGLAGSSAGSPSVKGHLNRILAHLTIIDDLMLYGTITPSTADLANAAKARMDVNLGSATTSYGPNEGAIVAPGSLVSTFGDASRSPFSLSSGFAALFASRIPPFEVGGVNVTMGQQAAAVVSVSPSRVTFQVPSTLPVGPVEVIVTSQDGYVSRGMVTIAQNVSRIMTAGEDYNGRAVAMNSGNQTVDSFDVNTGQNFGDDKRTRLMFFTTGLTGSAANTDLSNDVNIGGVLQTNFAESVAVEASMQDGQTVRLPVGFAGAQGLVPGLDEVVVLLTPNLKNAGTVHLTLIVGGQRSNAPTIFVS